MRRSAVIGLVVLASIFLGAFAAGTPVNGNDTVAATTAGIEIGASTHAAPRVVASPVSTQLGRQVLVAVLALVAAAVVIWRLDDQRAPQGRSVLRWVARARRGPPALV